MDGENPDIPSAEAELPPTDPETVNLLKHYPTLFGNVNEKDIIFCIDTSGSMYNSLDAVKEELKKTLMKLSLVPDSHFNLIEFSSEVTQWSDRIVKCTPETVMIAQEWIDKLEAKTGTNAQDALLAALSDEGCEAVCFITDGLPDQNPIDVLDTVINVAGNRPIHCYYIENGCTDPSSIDFLQDLAIETFGSFHIICVTQHGAIESITPVYRAETKTIRSTSGNIFPAGLKECSVTGTLDAPGKVIVEGAPPVYMHDVHGNYWPRFPATYSAYPAVGQLYHCYPHTGWSRLVIIC